MAEIRASWKVAERPEAVRSLSRRVWTNGHHGPRARSLAVMGYALLGRAATGLTILVATTVTVISARRGRRLRRIGEVVHG